MDLECEVPTCTLKYGDWTVCFLYREWMKCGDSKTRDLELQKSRWKTFIPKWKSLTGKSLVLGDYNFCFLNGNSPYQRQFQEMRDLVEENFLLDGWSQLVQDCTRHQRNNIPSLLDHVYSNDLSFFDRVYNLSIIDSDHNCIGVRLRHDGQVHYSKIIEKRDYEGINDEEFERIFLTSHSWNIFVDAEGNERIKHLWDIYLEQDIDEALAKFNQRVNSAMDRLAPKKSITIRKKFFSDPRKPVTDYNFILHPTLPHTGLGREGMPLVSSTTGQRKYVRDDQPQIVYKPYQPEPESSQEGENKLISYFDDITKLNVQNM